MISLIVEYIVLAPIALSGSLIFLADALLGDWIGMTVGLAATVIPTVVLVRSTVHFLKVKKGDKVNVQTTVVASYTQPSEVSIAFCHKCGAANTINARYCTECGSKLKEGEE